jgi:membrane fusion protein (multidrug efflux system)
MALYANIGCVINRKNLILTFLINIFLINLSHIALAQTSSASNKLLRVQVSIAKYEKLTTISNFVGRVEATEKVDIKPEVSGRLKEIKFKDGSFVEMGDVLFVIDSEKYELEVRQNEALVKVSEASLANENVQLERSKFLAANKAIAQSQYDTQKREKLTAEAKLEQSKIQLYVSQMKLHQTQVKAPISGRVGRSSTSVGNEVGPEKGALTKIVNDKLVKIYFPVTQRELLQGLHRRDDGTTLKLTIELPDGSILNEKGLLNFYDVSADEKTDSITLGANLNNVENLLFDGEIVHVIASRESRDKYLTIPRKSVLIDQNGSYCFVVNNDNTVSVKRISTEQENGQNIVVKSGIALGDKVVLSSDRLQAGMKVDAEIIP